MGVAQLIDDRVLIERSAKDKMRGKLFLPDNSIDDKREGFVVTSGPGRLMPLNGVRVPVACQVGEKVMWRAWATTALNEVVGIGRDFDVGGRDLVLVKETDLLTVVEPQEETCRVCDCTENEPCGTDDEDYCGWAEDPNEYGWGLCTAHEGKG